MLKYLRVMNKNMTPKITIHFMENRKTFLPIKIFGGYILILPHAVKQQMATHFTSHISNQRPKIDF